MELSKQSVLVLLFICASFGQCFFDEDERFTQSFLDFYDVSVAGRYTHEYHPFLFEKSSYSLDEMEEKLTENGFDIKGRIVLTGYEEQAIPSYYTHYTFSTGARINDESKCKSRSGWVEQLHNKFGVMTGYLFRDVDVVNRLHARSNQDALFDHVNLHVMPIYDQRMLLFQRHAFGRMLPIMRREKERLERFLVARDEKRIYKTLVTFWEQLYACERRFGNKSVAGTQDILFSCAHARHLFRSNVPLFKYYIGPDITYPIKISQSQKCSATYNAQTFVKKVVRHLVPMDDEPTVYIFCSFVDGVGKSTLLGNVQNYKKYGERYDQYDSVDNSSSQLAQLYNYDDNVFIADLPAQMSHFTYKPDGMVYCDVWALGEDEALIRRLEGFLLKQKTDLIRNYEMLCDDVRHTVAEGGWFDRSLLDRSASERVFVKNLFLLKKHTNNTWIPFSYEGKHYLFDKNDVTSIRQLVQLESADSVGLKNYDAEQMLFYEGIRFPLHYSAFLQDLIDQFKENGIKKVVFVNFLSMYPRSSRENVRVNYLLQLIALFDETFDRRKSFYGDFVGDAHLLYCLKHDKNGAFCSALQQEALVRLSLYKIMCEATRETIDGIPLEEITDAIRGALADVPRDLLEKSNELAVKKLREERRALDRVHGLTKNFINVQELDFDEVILLCDELQKMMTGVHENKTLKKLWQKPGRIRGNYELVEGEVEQQVRLSDGSLAHLLYVISPHCKNEGMLTPVMHTLRASWYASIVNFLEKDMRFFVPPVWVQRTEDGKIAFFRRVFKENKKEVPEDRDKMLNFLDINNRMSVKWGVFEGEQYLLTLNEAQTESKLFAFGANLTSFKGNQWPGLDRNVSYFVYDEKYKVQGKEDRIISTDCLWDGLHKKYGIDYVLRRVVSTAKANTKKAEKKKEGEKETKKNVAPKATIMLVPKEKCAQYALAVRALATVELLLKDPDGNVAIRRDNKKDFVAALKLFEKIFLPTYCNCVIENDLFQDYFAAKPLVLPRI